METETEVMLSVRIIWDQSETYLEVGNNADTKGHGYSQTEGCSIKTFQTFSFRAMSYEFIDLAVFMVYNNTS